MPLLPYYWSSKPASSSICPNFSGCDESHGLTNCSNAHLATRNRVNILVPWALGVGDGCTSSEWTIKLACSSAGTATERPETSQLLWGVLWLNRQQKSLSSCRSRWWVHWLNSQGVQSSWRRRRIHQLHKLSWRGLLRSKRKGRVHRPKQQRGFLSPDGCHVADSTAMLLPELKVNVTFPPAEVSTWLLKPLLVATSLSTIRALEDCVIGSSVCLKDDASWASSASTTYPRHFQGHEYWNVNISKTVKASEKCSNTTFVEVDICHQIGPLRILYSIILI